MTGRIRGEQEKEMQRREAHEHISQNIFPLTVAVSYMV